MSNTVIKPTIGRIVWFKGLSDQPMAAIISRVHSDTMVNLTVCDDGWLPPTPRCSVTLSQEEYADIKQGECCWMPYQKQVAAKEHTAVEALAAEVQHHQV